MSDAFSKVEVITGVARRRRFTIEQKLAVVAETMQPGMTISYVARRHGLAPSLVLSKLILAQRGACSADASCHCNKPIAPRAGERADASASVACGAWAVQSDSRHPRGLCCGAPAVRARPMPPTRGWNIGCGMGVAEAQPECRALGQSRTRRPMRDQGHRSLPRRPVPLDRDCAR